MTVVSQVFFKWSMGFSEPLKSFFNNFSSTCRRVIKKMQHARMAQVQHMIDTKRLYY